MSPSRVAAAFSLWLVAAPSLHAGEADAAPRAYCPTIRAGDTQVLFLDRVRQSCDVAWRAPGNRRSIGGETHAGFLAECARRCASERRIARHDAPNVGVGTDAAASAPGGSGALGSETTKSGTVGAVRSALVAGAMLSAAIAAAAVASHPADRPASP